MQASNDICVWYGECESDKFGRTLNCPYNGPPKMINNSNSIDVLKRWCPDFLEEYSKGKLIFVGYMIKKLTL